MKEVSITVEGRFEDNITPEVKNATAAIDQLEKEAKDAQKVINAVGKTKVKPVIDADTNRIDKKLNETNKKLDKLKRTTSDSLVLRLKDYATDKIKNALNMAKSWNGKTYSALLKIRDSEALSSLKKVSGYAQTLVGKTWTTVVRIKDFATAPLRTIRNMLFSVQSLVMAITAGLAAKQLIMNPIGLADAYSSAQIGFSTLLGNAAGQQMMNNLDDFAKATPFKSSEVIAQTQRMLAMGWNVDDIITDMTTIGDAAAATGKGEQGLQAIVTALSQIRSKGKLSTEELIIMMIYWLGSRRHSCEETYEITTA